MCPFRAWGCPHAATAAVCCWHSMGPLEKGQRVLSLGPGSQPAIVVAYGPWPSREGTHRSNVIQTPLAEGFTRACSSLQALGYFRPEPLGGCTKFDPLTEGEDWVGWATPLPHQGGSISAIAVERRLPLSRQERPSPPQPFGTQLERLVSSSPTRAEVTVSTIAIGTQLERHLFPHLSSPIKGEAIVSAIAVVWCLPLSGQERPSQPQLIRTKLEWCPFPPSGGCLRYSS